MFFDQNVHLFWSFFWPRNRFYAFCIDISSYFLFSRGKLLNYWVEFIKLYRKIVHILISAIWSMKKTQLRLFSCTHQCSILEDWAKKECQCKKNWFWDSQNFMSNMRVFSFTIPIQVADQKAASVLILQKSFFSSRMDLIFFFFWYKT